MLFFRGQAEIGLVAEDSTHVPGTVTINFVFP